MVTGAIRSGLNLAVVCDAFSRRGAGGFYERFLSDIQTAAEQRGFALGIYRVGEYPTLTSLARVLEARGVSAVFLVSRRRPLEVFTEEFPLHRFYAASIHDSQTSRTALHDVNYDYQVGAQMVLQELYDRGYRRPGLVLDGRTDQRIGFLGPRFHSPYGEAVSRSAKVVPPFTAHNPGGKDGWEDLDAWYERHRPDVIISRKSARAWLKHRKLRIPHDIGYVNLGVPEYGVPTSGLIADTLELANAALDLILMLMHTNKRGSPAQSVSHRITPQWNPGRTLRKRAPR